MKVLSVNAGSSSLKVQLFEMPEGETMISAVFEKIGEQDGFYRIKVNDEKIRREKPSKTHEDAVNYFLQELIDLKVIEKYEDIDGVGHRVVHGGDQYSQSVIITDKVIADIDKYSALAPLHNPANVLGIKAFKQILPDALMVAVFDTAFHQTMEESAYIYAVPYEWYETFGIRKYGFHGTSHKYVYQELERITEKKGIKAITCHLGNGGSITAIKEGKCIDTSLGFTPIAGIPMGTRCGDIDVSIVEYIMRKTNKTIEEVMNNLNKKSGLLGVSGVSNDARDIQAGITNGNNRCRLALDIYVNKIVSFISYYNTLLGGTDAIVFTAGIGENESNIRKEIINKLSPIGVILDEEKNMIKGQETLISTEESKIKCYAIPTNEELMIAKDVYDFSH